MVTEHIARNMEKLERARADLEVQERRLQTSLRSFMYRRPVHFRQMFVAFFRKYLTFVAQPLGSHCLL